MCVCHSKINEFGCNSYLFFPSFFRSHRFYKSCCCLTRVSKLNAALSLALAHIHRRSSHAAGETKTAVLYFAFLCKILLLSILKIYSLTRFGLLSAALVQLLLAILGFYLYYYYYSTLLLLLLPWPILFWRVSPMRRYRLNTTRRLRLRLNDENDNDEGGEEETGNSSSKKCRQRLRSTLLFFFQI